MSISMRKNMNWGPCLVSTHRWPLGFLRDFIFSGYSLSIKIDIITWFSLAFSAWAISCPLFALLISFINMLLNLLYSSRDALASSCLYLTHASFFLITMSFTRRQKAYMKLQNQSEFCFPFSFQNYVPIFLKYQLTFYVTIDQGIIWIKQNCLLSNLYHLLAAWYGQETIQRDKRG